MHEQTLQKRNFMLVSELQNVSLWFMAFVSLKRIKSFFIWPDNTLKVANSFTFSLECSKIEMHYTKEIWFLEMLLNYNMCMIRLITRFYKSWISTLRLYMKSWFHQVYKIVKKCYQILMFVICYKTTHKPKDNIYLHLLQLSYHIHTINIFRTLWEHTNQNCRVDVYRVMSKYYSLWSSNVLTLSS